MKDPTTLEECFAVLDVLLGDEREALLREEGTVVRVHHGLGRHIRNEWGLWSGSVLAKHLREKHGLDHPDDMSHFILTTYIRSKIPTLWERVASDST